MSQLSKIYLQTIPCLGRRIPSSCVGVQRRYVGHATRPASLPVTAGTQIPGFDFFKDKEPAVALERREYPDWVDKLATPAPSLAKLRRMPVEEADDKLKKRFLKLKRRMVIKENNRGLAK